MPTTAHVVPAEGGGWTVQSEGNDTHSPKGDGGFELFQRKRDAEAFAKDFVRQRGGGEVVLHTPSGRVTEVDTVVAEAPATRRSAAVAGARQSAADSGETA